MYLSATKETAHKAYDEFLSHYSAKYPGACKCLEKDKQQSFSLSDFPAEHWCHTRATNPIESMFATTRYRTRQAKGCSNRVATLAMVFKMGMAAEKRWRRLKGFVQLPKVVAGVKFKDGEEIPTKEQIA